MRTAVITSRDYHPRPVMVEPPRTKTNPRIERYKEDIKFYKQYAADLRNGVPVNNISPSGDTWFLIPENIDIIIQSLESALTGKFRVVNPKNVWEGL